jgi:hypothetical protein
MRNSVPGQRLFKFMVALAVYSLAAAVFAQGKSSQHEGKVDDLEQKGTPQTKIVTSIMWIDYLGLLPGDPSVVTSFNAVSSGVGSGLSGLIIMSTTPGDTASRGGNKVVEKGLQVPPGFLITGVRVCYELSNQRSFIDDIRLIQVQDPPGAALVLLDDTTQQVNSGPVCVDSGHATVNPDLGAVRLDLRVNFGDASDKIVVLAVALNLEGKPANLSE